MAAAKAALKASPAASVSHFAGCAGLAIGLCFVLFCCPAHVPCARPSARTCRPGCPLLPSPGLTLPLWHPSCLQATLAQERAQGTLLRFRNGELEGRYRAWYSAGQVRVRLCCAAHAVLPMRPGSPCLPGSSAA